MRLVTLRLVSADDHLEQVAERHVRERELNRRAPLGGDNAEPPPLVLEANEHVVHAFAAAQVLVQRLVVRAVDVHELLDPVGRERVHLRLEAGPADRLHQILVGVVAPENLARRVPHRGEDDPAGVDDRSVEVEEDDRESHRS